MPFPTMKALLVCLAAALTTGAPGPASAQVPREVIRSFLWPTSEADLRAASARLADENSLEGVGRERMERFLAAMPARPVARAAYTPNEETSLAVEVPGWGSVDVLVRLPAGYTAERPWPLVFAMHGGPPTTVAGAAGGARRMIDAWADAAGSAGWIVAAPVMASVVARAGRAAERLPYEMFHPEDARAVLDALRGRFSIDPNRIVATGISLGSNFSIAYAAAHPDWFSAIVPVSTEGESRELLVRNLAHVPTYVLQGAQDRNIRGVSGPRALERIMTALEYDLTYREFPDRAHEGFQEHYPEVLEWLERRPRALHPKYVLRVPHGGIVQPSRRFYWVESAARQGLVRARVLGPSDIDVTARWTGEVTLYLNDRLVDLDESLTVRVNGEVIHDGTVERSMRVALVEARRVGDESRLYAARLALPVPTGPEAVARSAALWDSLAPTSPEGPLSFWEMYAMRALEERFPSPGFEGTEVEVPPAVRPAPEQVALDVTAVDAGGAAERAGLRAGDVLVSFGGEPFFRGRGGTAGLHHWLVRELRSTPTEYELLVLRDGQLQTLTASYALGPYEPPPSR